MRELAQNILDLAENSLSAGATEIKISIFETDLLIVLTVSDNGCGMNAETLKRAADPFFSTKGTVGLGLSMLKDEALRTGGTFDIESSKSGTTVTAALEKTHIDAVPLGDIAATVLALSASDARIIFSHRINGREIALDTDNFTGSVFQNHKVIKDNLHRQYFNS